MVEMSSEGFLDISAMVAYKYIVMGRRRSRGGCVVCHWNVEEEWMNRHRSYNNNPMMHRQAERSMEKKFEA